MPAQYVYGMSGFKGSGKNTVADVILQRHEGQRTYSFAAVLKDGVSTIFGWPRELMEGDTTFSREWREREDPYWSAAFRRPITPRIALQEVGTNLFRAWLPNFWVHASARRAASDTIQIFTDARFRNEMMWLRETNGVILWVYRHENTELNAHDRATLAKLLRSAQSLKDTTITLTSSLHASESAFLTEGADLIDIVIENNGSLDELRRMTAHIDYLLTTGDLALNLPFRRATLYVSCRFDQFVWRWTHEQQYYERIYDIMNMSRTDVTSAHHETV